MMIDRRQDIVRHFPKILQRWRGASARLAELTVSHATLLILVRRPGEPENLIIACIGPLRIKAPYEWDDCDFEVIVNDAGGFLVLDRNADVAISTEHVEIKENVKMYSVA